MLPSERAEFQARLALAEQEAADLEDSDGMRRYAGTLGVQPELV